MKDISSLTTAAATAIETNTGNQVSTASTNLENKVRNEIVAEVVQDQIGIDDITNIATKSYEDTKKLEVEGKLEEQYITAEDIAKTYQTASQVASTALSTAVDVTDAGLKGSFNSIWKNYNPDNMSLGYFYTKKLAGDGSYALLWNEPDGGGSQYYNKTQDLISYVGTNDGGENDICVQIYSKSYSGANYSETYDSDTGITETSGLQKNEGVRININPHGAYYTKGIVTTANGGSPENEIATKKDVQAVNTALNNHVGNYTNLRNRLTELETLVGTLQTALANAVDANGNVVYTIPQSGADDSVDDDL